MFVLLRFVCGCHWCRVQVFDVQTLQHHREKLGGFLNGEILELRSLMNGIYAVHYYRSKLIKARKTVSANHDTAALLYGPQPTALVGSKQEYFRAHFLLIPVGFQ